MKKEKPKRSNLEKLVIDLTAPMKMKVEIELKQIAVFVGANDTGKSFILKLAYALSSVGMCKEAPASHIESAQFVFDNTFTEQNLNGSVKAIYTQGSVSVDLHEGKVVNVEIADLEKPVPIIFMSTDLRTFDQMSIYLRLLNESGKDPLISMKKMLGAYRLYDITYMGSLIARCPITLDIKTRKTLKVVYAFKEEIVSIEVDLDNCRFYAVLEDGTKKNLSTYGAGHQSILNMFIGVA